MFEQFKHEPIRRRDGKKVHPMDGIPRAYSERWGSAAIEDIKSAEYIILPRGRKEGGRKASRSFVGRSPNLTGSAAWRRMSGAKGLPLRAEKQDESRIGASRRIRFLLRCHTKRPSAAWKQEVGQKSKSTSKKTR